MESSPLWCPVWTLTLVTTCHSAIVTQTPGVNCSCILWQKVDLLFNQGEAQPREIPPATALLQWHSLWPGRLGHCKEINVHGNRSLPWAPGVAVQSNSSTRCGHLQLLPLILLRGKWYIFKPGAGQSAVTAAGCRYQTPDCSQKKKEAPVASESVVC